MDKEDKVYEYNGILLNHKKEWCNAICNNIVGPKDYHTSDVSQTEKGKYMILLIGEI